MTSNLDWCHVKGSPLERSHPHGVWEFLPWPQFSNGRLDESVPEWKQIGMLRLTSNAPIRPSPTSTSKTTNRWTDGLDERNISKGIFFYFKTLHIQTTCQKCFQTHLAIYRNVIGNWDRLKVEHALRYNHVLNISNTPFKERIGGRRSVFKDRLWKNEETASVCLSVCSGLQRLKKGDSDKSISQTHWW